MSNFNVLERCYENLERFFAALRMTEGRLFTSFRVTKVFGVTGRFVKHGKAKGMVNYVIIFMKTYTE